MGRTCTVCTHPERPAIDRALTERSVSYRTIADQFRLSETSLKRHKTDHIPPHVAKAVAAAEIVAAGSLLDQIDALRSRALAILAKAEAAGDYRTALMGIREARACIETLLEVEGELDRRGVTNIIVSPQWIDLRARMVVALRPYPDAAAAVAVALSDTSVADTDDADAHDALGDVRHAGR